MLTANNIIDLDLSHVWHPCSQMKDYETFKPIVVTSAAGSYIKTTDGRKIIDAISSWWCKSLGHQHPKLKTALLAQLEKFEHVILANTTNSVIAEFSAKLTQLTKSLKKVFFASDGSSAVEIAMKMSLHAHQAIGQVHKNKFIALSNSYHGETLATMSVSDVGLYRQPYESLLFDSYFISEIPYVNSIEDPLWSDCASEWQVIEKKLESQIATTTAIILEPIVQGAGGMKIYSQDFLKRIRAFTKEHGIHLIADEIMTGIGRTGKMFACEYANIEADFMCLSKGLTSGWLPFSVVLTKNSIYDIFYQDSLGKAFLHSHTFSGNVLAASVALEVLNIMHAENMCARAAELGKEMLHAMREIAQETKVLSNVRGIGAIVAADLNAPAEKRLGYAIFQEAIKRGALLRPLGNTIYWLPPLNLDKNTLKELKNITLAAINSICRKKL